MDVVPLETALTEARRLLATILKPLRPCLVGALTCGTLPSGRLVEIRSFDEVADAGPVTPANPLLWGLHHAFRNNGGAPVTCVAVAQDDLAGWSAAVGALGNEAVYSLVPLTNRDDVHKLFIDHVADPNLDDLGLRRVLWLPVFSTTQLGAANTHKVHFVVGADAAAAAAALAGLSGAVVPQQPLQAVRLRVPPGVPSADFVAPNLWSVSDSGTAVDPAVAERERRYRVIHAWSHHLRPFLKTWKTADLGALEIRSKLRAQFTAGTLQFIQQTGVRRTGSVLLAADFRTVRPHCLFEDRIVIGTRLELPGQKIFAFPLVA